MGTGLGDGGAGVRQGSGMAKVLPPWVVEAGNMAGMAGLLNLRSKN